MRLRLPLACLVAALTACGTPVSVLAQVPGRPSEAAPQVRRLGEDDVVRLALEHNLGIRIARIGPQIEDLTVAQARGGWAPTFSSSFQSSSNTQPPNSILSGGSLSVNTDQFSSTAGFRQALRWGGSYEATWDGSRLTTNNIFTNFSPQLRSSLALSYTQPLVRNFSIDNLRQQLEIGLKNREVSDIRLSGTIASTARAVRNAYWNLAFAIASLGVQQQSLELARESLRNTRARVEIGITPPIDIVEAEAEVAAREEAVILAEAQIETAQDTLRALVFDPAAPDFWTVRVEPAELPAFQPMAVDTDAAVRRALDRRTDLRQARKSLEASDVTIRYLRNQTLPDVSATLTYNATGLGGTQFTRDTSQGFFGPVIGQQQRSFARVLGDLLGADFPSWTAAISLSYPIGGTAQDATLARARLQHVQTQTEIRNQELQVATEVRQSARQVLTNQQRVQTTRVARELAERRLDAEQRKFAAGTSTSFLVFQAQRDLSLARNNELRAVLDYNLSIVDFETVQETPLAGAR